jgi:hypothetical protein
MPCFPQTPTEAAAGVTPANQAIPSHASTGEVYPQRYGAMFNSSNDDTAALNNAFLVSQQSACPIVMPGGTSIVTGQLFYGTNTSVLNLASVSGTFQLGETVTGGTSGCRGVVHSISGSQLTAYYTTTAFIAGSPGETITGGTSGAHGTLSSYTQQQSSSGPGIRGAGVTTNIRAAAGYTGTLLAAKNCAGISIRDLVIDGNSTAAVCLDTSWTTVGPAALNEYINVFTQNYATNGHLAFNDNQSSWKDCVARGPAGGNTALSGFRVEGSGGSMFFDNITCGSFFSITVQNATIRGGSFVGIRVNETVTGINQLTFDGGTQIYPNQTQNCHFYDATPGAAGHSIQDLVANGLYLIGSSGSAPTNTFAASISNKVNLINTQFITVGTGAWNLYLPGLTQPFFHFPNVPSVVEINGGSLSSVVVNTPNGYLTLRRETVISGSGMQTDFPMRVVYRAAVSPGALSANTFFNAVPATAMAEASASYLLAISVNIPGIDALAVVANISQVGKNGGLGASGAISVPTTANFANNLTNQISLRYSVTTQVSGVWYAGVDMAINEATTAGTSVGITLIRVANPTFNY